MALWGIYRLEWMLTMFQLDNKLLFNYLPQLEEELAKEKEKPEDVRNQRIIDHLALLVDYVVTDFSPTAKRLYPLLQHHEITFDLLWALFLPNTLVYTTCPGSQEQRVVK